MIPCESDNNYWASHDFATFSLHLMTFIFLPLHAFGYYCILKKTPIQMSSVKGLLMLLHSLCFSFDVITTLFAVPYAIFPAMAGYGLGFIDSPGLFLYLMVTVITATSTTVFVIFENRFFILFAENSWWKHVRKYFIAISYAMVPLYFLPAQFFIPEQEPARKVVWESLECHPELPSHRDLFVLSTDFKIPGYSVLVAESVPAIQIAIFTSLNNYNLQYAKPSSNISVKTMRMQRRLAYCITIQFYIPEQESARKIVWESLGCQPELPQNRELFVLSTDFIAPTYSILIAELVPTIEVMVFTSLSNYHLLVAKPSSKLSKKSIYLQRKLSFIIMIQCYSDFFLFGLPVNAVVYIIKYWYHDQSINNLIFICLSFHGTASTLIMLLVHAPYRDFILSPFIRVLPKIPVILVRPNTSRE
ncbi:unnamed protein product [Caenorhabditis brenneri]